MGVREVFAQRCQTLGYQIVESQRGFPDYELLTPQGQKLKAEAEFVSENFILHGHDANGCNLVICWRHTQALEVGANRIPGMAGSGAEDRGRGAGIRPDLPRTGFGGGQDHATASRNTRYGQNGRRGPLDLHSTNGLEKFHR